MQTLSYDLCRKALLQVQTDCPYVAFQVQPDRFFMLAFEVERKEYTVNCFIYRGGVWCATYCEYVNTPSDVLKFCKEFSNKL